MERRKVRITNSDGYPFELMAIDTETGERIPRVKSITIEADAGSMTFATIKTTYPLIDLIAKAEVRSLVWVEQEDGTIQNVVSGEIRRFGD